MCDFGLFTDLESTTERRYNFLFKLFQGLQNSTAVCDLTQERKRLIHKINLRRNSIILVFDKEISGITEGMFGDESNI
jgi:hypothetical protein